MRKKEHGSEGSSRTVHRGEKIWDRNHRGLQNKTCLFTKGGGNKRPEPYNNKSNDKTTSEHIGRSSIGEPTKQISPRKKNVRVKGCQKKRASKGKVTYSEGIEEYNLKQNVLKKKSRAGPKKEIERWEREGREQ